MTLLMRDQENIEKGMEKGIEQGIEQGIEKGMEQGIEQGMEKGISGMVSTLKDLGIPDATIVQKLQEKFRFSREKAEKYLR